MTAQNLAYQPASALMAITLALLLSRFSPQTKPEQETKLGQTCLYFLQFPSCKEALGGGWGVKPSLGS